MSHWEADDAAFHSTPLRAPACQGWLRGGAEHHRALGSEVRGRGGLAGPQEKEQGWIQGGGKGTR